MEMFLNVEKGIFIAYIYICDGKKDCPGDIAFDEITCICENSLVLSSKCKYIVSNEGIKRCSPFFLTLKDGTCILYGLVKINNTLEAPKLKFPCISDNIHVKNYLTTDCSPNRDNEKKPILEYNSNSICQENGQLPCRGQDNKCYNITEMCIYRLNKNNLLNPCRTGEHVANCSLIQCNMNFKCPGFYCIPWSYVCDGKWDCPGGYDEGRNLKCGINRNCRNMFKCRNSQKCIHVGDVCNGLQDCHTGDDEYMCSLTGFLCPSLCVCIGLAISCKNASYAYYTVSIPSYNAVFLNYCDLTFLEPLLRILKSPTFLSIRYNNLNSVCKILPDLSKTLTIDLGSNLVEYVNPDCFRNGFQLISIKLDNNIISVFQRVVIFQFKKLLYLNLNNNFISTLFSDYHLLGPVLKLLSIKNNRLSTISPRFFDHLNIKIIVTDNYFICCKTPFKSICTSVKLWFESCKHLLLQRSITVCGFCYSLFLIISNIFTAFLHKLSHLSSKDNYSAFEIMTNSISLIDITWGIYLINLVASDFIFEDNFVIQESLFKSSLVCFILFSINLNFSILSPLLSALMSFSKFMVVIFPFDSNFKNRKFVLNCCNLMYGFVVTLVIVFTVSFKHLHSSVPFRLCSPFINYFHSNVMLTIATCGVAILQFSVYILEIFLNCKIMLELKSSVHQKQNITSLITQMSIMTVSKTLYWIPSSIIFLICLFTEKFSIIMITWVVIAVTSIHPVTNSFLFIITTARKWRNQL